MSSTSDELDATSLFEGASGIEIARMVGGSALVLLGIVSRGWIGLGLAAIGGAVALTSPARERLLPRLTRHDSPGEHAMTVDALATVTIDASPEALYDRWRDLPGLPSIHRHVLAVEDLGSGRSRWQVRGPGKRVLQWDAELLHEEPGHRLTWRSLPGGDLDHEGEVTFQEVPGGRGTVVTVGLRYAPPGARFGAALAGLMGHAPNRTLREDLRRFKQLVETGEIATTEGQPSGRTAPAGQGLKLGQQVADALDILIHPLHPEVRP